MLNSSLHGVLHPTIFRRQSQCRIKVVQEDAFLRDAVVVEGRTVHGATIIGIHFSAMYCAIKFQFSSRNSLRAEIRRITNESAVLGYRHLHSSQVYER